MNKRGGSEGEEVDTRVDDHVGRVGWELGVCRSEFRERGSTAPEPAPLGRIETNDRKPTTLCDPFDRGRDGVRVFHDEDHGRLALEDDARDRERHLSPRSARKRSQTSDLPRIHRGEVDRGRRGAEREHPRVAAHRTMLKHSEVVSWPPLRAP